MTATTTTSRAVRGLAVLTAAATLWAGGGLVVVPSGTPAARAVTAGATPADAEIDALAARLAAHRAAGRAPATYAVELERYWALVATRNAGLDLDHWDPALGLAANTRNLERTFAYYCRLGLDTPEFLWAGQGGLAGPSFAAGIMDLDLARVVLDVAPVRGAVAGSIGALHAGTAAHTAGLPDDLRAMIAAGEHLTTEDIDHFQREVIAMSKAIFVDLVPQHEAYLAGGLPALEEYRAAGLIDDRTLGAWRTIARGAAVGDHDAVVDGNLTLLHREQFDVIGDSWDAVSGYRHPVGRALTYLSTVAADPAVPGLAPPREVAPLRVEAGDVGSAGGPVASPGSSDWRVQVPLTGFNWADRHARWEYIEARMAPAYRDLRVGDEARWRATLERPVELRIADQRAGSRLPALLWSMAGVTGSA